MRSAASHTYTSIPAPIQYAVTEVTCSTFFISLASVYETLCPVHMLASKVNLETR